VLTGNTTELIPNYEASAECDERFLLIKDAAHSVIRDSNSKFILDKLWGKEAPLITAAKNEFYKFCNADYRVKNLKVGTFQIKLNRIRKNDEYEKVIKLTDGNLCREFYAYQNASWRGIRYPSRTLKRECAF